MNRIFVDFEMTCIDNRKASVIENTNTCREIIEIGAVRIDDQGMITDRFTQLVKAEWEENITKRCTQITGITKDTLKDAPLLAEALVLFENWVGKEEVKFYAWGDDDLVQLKLECKFKGLYDPLPTCYKRWRNYQRIFMKLFNISRSISLKDAINMVGFDFEGKQHSAVDDAYNTARILLMTLDKEKYQELKQKISEAYNTEVTLSSSIGDLLAEKFKAFIN